MVFDHMTRQGADVDELIQFKQEDGMNYEAASREVVAEAMADILPDSHFAEELARQHQNIFEKLLEKLKEFLEDIRTYFTGIYENRDLGANALKEELDGTVRYLEDIVKVYDKMAVSAVEHYQAAEVEENTEENVQYEIRYPIYTEAIVEANMKSLAELPSVYDVPAEKLKKTGKRPSDLFSAFFDSLGNNIFTDEFGDVALTRSSVKSEVRHGITAEKLASIEAIPTVLKRGKVIFAGRKGNSDVDRIVVCAPINIDGQSYYMGIMLQRDSQSQRLYMHNVAIEKEMSDISQADLLTTGALEKNEHLFMTNILQRAISVKTYSMQQTGSYTGKDNLDDTANEQRVSKQKRAGEPAKYSYEWFVAKPDMRVTRVDDDIQHSRAEIVSLALKNAASVGYINQNGNAVVRVKDMNTDVIVPKRSLVHGLDRRINTQAPVLVKVGEILKNSIRVNELIPRTKEIKNAYTLIGSARNQDGNLYIASFIVNKYSNEVSEINVLYSANTKKEPAALLPKITDKSATPTDSNISITKLLDHVNRYFPDILPEDVLKHYGYDSRPEGNLSQDVLYQKRTNTLSDREVLEIAAIRMDTETLNAGEKAALDIFQKRLNKLKKLQIERERQGHLWYEQQFVRKKLKQPLEKFTTAFPSRSIVSP